MLFEKFRKPLDLSGFFEGIVVVNEDPESKGRVGVAIKKLMPFAGTYKKKDEKQETVAPNSNKDSNNNLSGTQNALTSVNYLWCNRASNRFEQNDETTNKKAQTGSFIIPPVGATVFVIFLNRDIRCPYYLPFGPSVEGNEKLINGSGDGDINTDLIHQTVNKDIVGFDNATKEFYIQMSDKSGLTINADKKTILIHTAKSAAKVELDDDEINITADTVNVKAKDILVQSESSITFDSKGTISIKTTDSAAWAPNIIQMCPIGNFMHGGSAAAINNLKGM